MKNKGVLILLIILLIVTLVSGVVSTFSYTATEYALDTMCTVTAYGWGSKKAVLESVDKLKKLENKLSVHRDNSDISVLNREKTNSVDDDVYNMLKTALKVSEDTEGAFDITVKPLVDLWNIKGNGPVPSAEDITYRLNSISYKNVELSKNQVILNGDNTEIDLGGIAKGYCADAIANVLTDHGIKSAIIDLGGNVRTIGKKKGNTWKIGIQDPEGKRGEYFGVLGISNKCVVTSGGYERYFVEDGKIYHHIIDPRTGYPVDSDITSVSIIADDGVVADALSTAVYVMGVEKGLALLNSLEYNGVGYIITDKNGKVLTSENIDFEITSDKYKR